MCYCLGHTQAAEQKEAAQQKLATLPWPIPENAALAPISSEIQLSPEPSFCDYRLWPQGNGDWNHPWVDNGKIFKFSQYEYHFVKAVSKIIEKNGTERSVKKGREALFEISPTFKGWRDGGAQILFLNKGKANCQPSREGCVRYQVAMQLTQWDPPSPPYKEELRSVHRRDVGEFVLEDRCGNNSQGLFWKSSLWMDMFFDGMGR